ncbi:MAG: hypothetical protein JST93_19650 [Acidobacteria bacterium]|nr:hypothetical protein [Acidobacteriota bacterium]
MLNFTRYQPAGRVVRHRMFAIVDRLQTMYGPRLELVRLDGDWLTFRVLGVVEATLLLELQKRAVELFGPDLNEYQVTAPCNGKGAEGVSVRWVGYNRQNEADYSGFWFY